MTLRFKWGEFGEVNPIKCVDSQGNDADITYAAAGQSTIYILSENKTKIKLTIDSADFTIVSPNVNWTITKAQSETLPPGNYAGEVHVQDPASIRKAIFEFPVYVEKARGNIT